MDIKLNFKNETVGAINNNIVIYQKNVAEDFDEIAVAWKIIKECGRNWHHPFVYPLEFQVGGGDSNGNLTTDKLPATVGDAFEIYGGHSGHEFQKMAIPATSNKEVEVRNNLEKGAVSANIYKDGLLLAIKKEMVPKSKAVFQFLPKLYIGAVSDIKQGDVMNSAVISQCNTELDLFGIKSADIVMSGGGSNANATAYVFRLENVEYM